MSRRERISDALLKAWLTVVILLAMLAFNVFVWVLWSTIAPHAVVVAMVVLLTLAGVIGVCLVWI